LVIPAAAVNAPHGRDRVWFVAQNAMLGGCVHGKDEQEGTEIWEFGNISPGNKDGVHLSKGDATNSNNFGSATGRTEIQKKNGEIPKRHDNTQFSNTDKSDATDTTSTRRRENIGRRKSRFNDQKSTSSNWQNFPTQSPICGGDDGLPTELDGVTFSKWRNESIKGYGNAIVPQVAYEIFKSIELAYSEITK
jgi:DNA (cytosine-5)-methyltransferase 1